MTGPVEISDTKFVTTQITIFVSFEIELLNHFGWEADIVGDLLMKMQESSVLEKNKSAMASHLEKGGRKTRNQSA